ncbi:PREDICTED: uncharacterized protein LOC103323386 [Prunus mume]|uniref:Uncharacterized protein LOC103323386 n=1 Tax=Prunus mume TaxID=102107 RepID=A0ABM1LIM2_PRUMU|nr:PREDICTED: uncharacterized protein LOC103323386 [Prunus mume]
MEEKDEGKMFASEKTLIFNKLSPYLFVKKNGREFGTISAKRRHLPEDPSTQEQFIFPLRVKISNPIVAGSVVAVLGLGFIDAGYSGDWSRIGVISKESEDLLKVAAFVVVPLCVFLIISFFKEQED